MPQLTLIEKLQVLFDNVLAYPLFLILLSIPLIIWLLKRKGIGKKAVIVYLITALVLVIINFKSIFKLLDNFVEYIITILNFPTMGLILLVVITSFVLVILSTIKNYRKSSKIINLISFVIIQILFGIILTRISTYSIDFSKTDILYANLDVVIIMQLIMGVFALQLFLLFIIKCINKVTDMLEKEIPVKEEIKESATLIVDYEMPSNPLPVIEMPEPVIPITKEMPKETLVPPLKFDEETMLVPPLEIEKAPETNKPELPVIDINPVMDNETVKEDSLIKTEEPVLPEPIVQKEEVPVPETIFNMETPVVETITREVKQPAIEVSKPVKEEVKPNIVIPSIDIFEAPIIETEEKVIEPVKEVKEPEIFTAKSETPKQQTTSVKETVVNPGPINDIAGIMAAPDIEKISSRVDNMQVSSNKFVNEDTKKQMEEELLAYKKQLLEYKKKQETKEDTLRKQMEDFSTIFNITQNDLKTKSY